MILLLGRRTNGVGCTTNYYLPLKAIGPERCIRFNRIKRERSDQTKLLKNRPN
jgi:hypothetical protein